MQQLKLLRSLPSTVRNVKARSEAKDQRVIDTARRYDYDYFDGDRKFGYGGYFYDGRWVPVAKDIIAHYGLKKGAKILDVGCAKGFLVKDLCDLGMEAYGIDISNYAINNCAHGMYKRLVQGNADCLPYPDEYFDLVLSINTIHNLDRERAKKALQEIMRVTKFHAFVQVDSYRNKDEKAIFESWVLTAKYHGYPEDWVRLFSEAGYIGDYDWTLV